MKRNYIFSFVAAALFTIASVLSFINGSYFRGVVGFIAAIAFLLSGIHYRRSNQNKP